MVDAATTTDTNVPIADPSAGTTSDPSASSSNGGAPQPASPPAPSPAPNATAWPWWSYLAGGFALTWAVYGVSRLFVKDS